MRTPETKHIFNLASQITKPVFSKHGDYFLALIENWIEIIPNSWLAKTAPAKLQWVNNNQATLWITIESNSLALTLSFDIPYTINKINDFFGHKVITRIKFVNK